VTKVFKLAGMICRADGSYVSVSYRLKGFRDAGLPDEDETRMLLKISDDNHDAGMLARISQEQFLGGDMWCGGRRVELLIAEHNPYDALQTRH
jgi:hypothetical protein